MTRFFDISRNKKSRYRVTEQGDHIFFFCNRSGSLEIEVRKPGAKVYILGFFVGRNRDVFRVRTTQRHLSPDSFSELFIKGVFSDEAKFDYNGLIRIEARAKDSHAYQKNQNLLLSGRARVESKPILEIMAKDVFCTHGSTTGKPDPDQIFYLQSRGLDRDRAIQTLAKGFLAEIMEKAVNLGVDPVKLENYSSLIN